MGSLTRRVLRRGCRSAAANAEGALTRLLGDTMGGPVPPILSHVTGSVDTLESILTSRSIWASRSTKVRGDVEELLAGEELAQQVVRKMLNKERRPVARTVLAEFSSAFSAERLSEKVPVFLSCFTPRIDGIHWDRYGAGDGVAITFTIMPSRQPDPEMELALVSVVYDEEVMGERLRAALARGLDLAEVAQCGHSRGWAEQTLRPLFFRIAGAVAVQTKRRKWMDENEWRLVAIPAPNSMHRIKQLPIEHVVIPLNPGAIPDVRDIALSPRHPAAEQAAARLRAFLLANGYPESIPITFG
jgi:hypothetical protein